MSEKPAASLSLHYLLIIALVLVLAAAWFFWPEKEQAPAPVSVKLSDPIVEKPTEQAQPEVLEEQQEQLIEPDNLAIEEPAPMPEPPAPVDTSDATVKTKILALADYESLARLVVDQDLLQRFVVFTDNLAKQDLANNHHLLQPPEEKFQVYQQAGKEWIDTDSFTRYNLYANMFEAIPAEQLIAIYREYQAPINERFAEIAEPGADFDQTLLNAIDTLLDTPQVPMPVEVYTDSVMYKYANPVLENLSAPQKQLLRTGPENMRKIKAKLREIKALLSGSE